MNFDELNLESVSHLQKITSFYLKKNDYCFNDFYDSFIKLIETTQSDFSYEIVFNLFGADSTPFWQRLFTFLYENHFDSLFEQISVIPCLPENLDLLLSGIYFLSLPQEEQINEYVRLSNLLLKHIQETRTSHHSKREKALLQTFRTLSTAKKDKAIEYLHFLALPQSFVSKFLD